MKTIIKSFVLIAAAALTLFACAKTENIRPAGEDETVTLKFNIHNADNATVSKALLGTEDGKNFLNWENGDKIGAYLTGTSNNNNRPGTVVVSGDTYTLNVTAGNTLTATKIYSYYPYSSGAGTDKIKAAVSIPELQYMTADGFDADAMPMAGTPVDVDLEIAQANTDTPCGEINFSNLGSIIKFRVYSSVATSETLTSVKFVTSGNVGGKFEIDLTSVDASDEATLALTATSETVNTITTSYSSHPAIGMGLDNAIDVYMVVAPGTYSGTQVVVTTNLHTYTLTASGEKTFTRSHVKPMKVDIQNGTQGDLPMDESWEETTLASLTSSDIFVIVGTNATTSYAMTNDNGTSSAPSAIAVTISDNKITSAVTSNMKWNISGNATDGYIFYPDGSTTTWLYCTATNNGVRVGTNSNSAFTLDSSGYLKNTATNRYVGVYSSQDWRCYTSSTATNINGQSFAFYVRTESGSSTPTNYAVTWTDPTEAGCSISATVNSTAIDSGDEFAAGTVVSITATAGTDYEFGGWTINGATLADASAATTTFTIGDSAVSFSATFNSTVVSATALPYEETFASGQGDFTIDNVALDGLSYVWSYDSSNKYMKASGYASSADHDVESWLISPLLEIPSLSTGETIKLKFTQCINKYFGTVADEATLMVKEESGSWAKVAITYPTLSGTWSSFEQQVVELSSYAGKNIQFAFKYVGTESDGCGTWEIKNVSVKKYEPKALSSISVSGQTTIFTKDDAFAFGGTVTATYNDETTADVTASATFTGYDMSTTGEQTVTVSYTESGVTKTTTYTITVNSSDTESVVYTLDGTITGGSSGYADESDITQNGISWMVMGNTTMNPWRIGGKSLSGEERTVYSTTPLAKNISKIEITHGTASNVTVNSMTVIVSKNSDFSSPVSTLTPTFAASGTVTVNRPDGKDWSNCYYKIVYNITISATSNKFIQFTKAEFTGK